MANREIPPLYGWPAPSEIPQYVLNIMGTKRIDENSYAIVFLKICSFVMAVFASYKVISILKLYIWIAQHLGSWAKFSDPFYLNNLILVILFLCGGGSILALKIPSFDENDPTLHILQLPILVTLIFVLLGMQSGIKKGS
ncbi:Oidioi.mRNA.OKI2018_I69.XSR.g13981.t1.cds [Oikopleura dioica]|uniref:Oidioi.mRNA.OKI2018_I69.XSR.g13981.t1.cds n=1 Tax=Oikopleura dioica TaxID=34765 RepID=A0ABN7S8H3_OIKDI|nr:Oidioi.mRNA.OKI2018_I69.XSR.g13981.t1.cds [Oikopleura dioica]